MGFVQFRNCSRSVGAEKVFIHMYSSGVHETGIVQSCSITANDTESAKLFQYYEKVNLAINV